MLTKRFQNIHVNVRKLMLMSDTDFAEIGLLKDPRELIRNCWKNLKPPEPPEDQPKVRKLFYNRVVFEKVNCVFS